MSAFGTRLPKSRLSASHPFSAARRRARATSCRSASEEKAGDLLPPSSGLVDACYAGPMKRLIDALFDPMHSVLAIIVAWVGTIGVIGDALDFWQPDYRRVLLVVIVFYWGISISQAFRSGR